MNGDSFESARKHYVDAPAEGLPFGGDCVRVALLIMAALGLVASLALAGCNAPAGSFPPAPVPPMPPAPLVVGHWVLEASTTGEQLRIEADGTFAEAGGSPFDVGCCTLTQGATWAGSWTFADPHLTLTDERTGPHAFGAVVQQFGAVLILQASRSYRFSRVAADAGAD